MAESVTIARPYAEAVFRLAKETGVLDTWSARLARLAMVSQDGEVASLIGNPQISAEKVVQLFVSLSEDSEINRSATCSAESRGLPMTEAMSPSWAIMDRR